jgi:hypothetical protein
MSVRCEYIFYRGMYRTSYARVSRGPVTDTELQIGQFVVPPYGTTVVDDSEAARYLRSQKEDLPKDHVSIFLFFRDRVNVLTPEISSGSPWTIIRTTPLTKKRVGMHTMSLEHRCITRFPRNLFHNDFV